MPNSKTPFMVTIPVSGPQVRTALDGVPGLETIKAALDGGFLEVVPHFSTFQRRPAVAFCDEEGKLKGLPVNRAANLLWAEALGFMPTNDVLVGPIVVIVGSASFLAKL